jgi:hypothetical protein
MILILDPHGWIGGRALADRNGGSFAFYYDNLNLSGRILRVNHRQKSSESQQKTEH